MVFLCIRMRPMFVCVGGETEAACAGMRRREANFPHVDDMCVGARVQSWAL